jgi:hypothetical protein
MGSITLQDVAIEHAMQQHDTGLVLDEVQLFFILFLYLIFFSFYFLSAFMLLLYPAMLFISKTRFNASV